MKRTRLIVAFIGFLSFVSTNDLLAHGTGKHVMGTASSVAADRLEVKTKEGKDVIVRLTPDTQFRRSGAGTSAKPQVGDRVAAEVMEDGDALTAVEVRFATPQAKK